jgi:hypothetical protein
MAIIGKLLKRGIRLRASIRQEYSNPSMLQQETLQKLLIKARATAFGKQYDFIKALTYFKSGKVKEALAHFQENVPIVDYNAMYSNWWHRSIAGERNVCWPGKVKYFALSSGTSEAASKHIPVTRSMMRAIQKAGVRQMLALSNYSLPDTLYEKSMLMLGGSTALNKQGTYFEGDLSGITTGQLPFWLQFYAKPGHRISRNKDWDRKLDEMVLKAEQWDIGYLLGVPAWVQILMEKVIAHYQLDHIHQIWPNLEVYVHGGVSFEPYRSSFDQLLGRPITYIETYLASEGFIAYQVRPNTMGMRMILNNGIFFEFIPFNEENFDADGQLTGQPKACMIHEVEEGVEYALLLSTCAGAWRYLIGDVIKFVNVAESEIVITGRTKHFLSLCGEHLSVDNMQKALQLTATSLGVDIKEWTVMGVPYEGLFAHQWYLACDAEVDVNQVASLLDEHLCRLNDDYAVERKAALKKLMVRLLPTSTFYDFMRKRGKIGGQSKFPRVLKKQVAADWLEFLQGE